MSYEVGKYTLSYSQEGKTVEVGFDTEIDIYDMSSQLRAFLLACSWHKETVDKILISED